MTIVKKEKCTLIIIGESKTQLEPQTLMKLLQLILILTG